jgi:lipopolysaccharide transport system ATP-binding protein
MNPIITVDNLSKLYRIGAREKGYKTFREAIIDFVSAPVRNFKRIRNITHFEESIFHHSGDNSEQPDNVIWALKDVSFEVQPGETIGIIGRNGAGKSTLLKILSRITEPTTGDVKIYGRVSSLLEVGTGFHPELTGRENIFLNGAVLGMKKAEIEQKFDEIVSFAEIEKFLDTPVRFYSSGMYVRLAFAVAAHLEPEVLLVDEVLAVGDIEFQKKCLGKMNDVARTGRTVFFVSHNLDAIKRLCYRTMLLSYGKIIEDGNTESTVTKYISDGIRGRTAFNNYIKGLRLGPIFKLYSIDINQNGNVDSELLQFVSSKDIVISFTYEVFEDSPKLFVNFELWDTVGNRLFETFHNGHDPNAIVKKGIYISRAVIPPNFLVPISYELKIWFGIWGSYDFTKEPISVLFDVYSDGVTNMVYGRRPIGGKIALPIRWNTKRI